LSGSIAVGFRGEVVNPNRGFGHKPGVIRLLLIGLALSWASPRADMLWDFQETDTRPSTIGGIYAYIYPSANDSTSHRTDAHTATLTRAAKANGGWGAQLRFVLDGNGFPSAGFGLMFPESQPLDLRELKFIRLHLSAESPRTVRISLASHQEAYETASDTGASLGCDTVVGPEGVDWVVPANRLTWPKWVADVPAVSENAIFASTFAIQLNVSCETPKGTCERDSGWLFLDSLRLSGVGGAWPSPDQGKGCFGDSIEVSKFNGDNPKKNGLSGWWYAFTDANASDSSKGESRILSASDTNLASSWRPDSLADRAFLDFRLQRVGAYSGFAGIETQFGPPDAQGTPVPVTISDLVSVGFDLEYGDFPVDLGGISFHVKKSGRYFQNGAEHQIRIPYDSVPHRWCLDLEDLSQPPWSAWQLAFTPDDLLSMSWEAKLQDVASTARGAFSIRNLRIYRNTGVGVASSIRSRSLAVHRVTGGLSLERAAGLGVGTAAVVDVRGRILARVDFAAGQREALLTVRLDGVSWIRYQDANGARTLPVGL
jgi:hypothetical protein